MHDDGEAQLAPQIQVLIEELPLYLARGVVVEEVEPGLAYRNHLSVGGSQCPYALDRVPWSISSFVRMHACGAPRSGSATDELEPTFDVIDIGGDRDPAAHSRFGSPTQHRLPVVPEGAVGKVAVAVKELDTDALEVYTVAGWCFFFSPVFPRPHFF